MINEYLYIFGYEAPSEKASNRDVGTDFESTGMVRILSLTEDSALEWGRELSERFVASLYANESVSWRSQGFASWIEQSPDEHIRSQWSSIPVVQCGEIPDTDTLSAIGPS